MEFFKASFKDFGETMRTLSLIIGLLVTSVTGVGYAYTVISKVDAHDVEIDNVAARVKILEADGPVRQVNRFRLDQTEAAVKELKAQNERTWNFLQEFRAEVNRSLPPKADR